MSVNKLTEVRERALMFEYLVPLLVEVRNRVDLVGGLIKPYDLGDTGKNNWSTRTKVMYLTREKSKLNLTLSYQYRKCRNGMSTEEISRLPWLEKGRESVIIPARVSRSSVTTLTVLLAKASVLPYYVQGSLQELFHKLLREKRKGDVSECYNKKG